MGLKLGEEAFQYLSQLLEKNSVLKIINYRLIYIVGNDMTEKGIELIVKAITNKYSRSLRNSKSGSISSNKSNLNIPQINIESDLQTILNNRLQDINLLKSSKLQRNHQEDISALINYIKDTKELKILDISKINSSYGIK